MQRRTTSYVSTALEVTHRTRHQIFEFWLTEAINIAPRQVYLNLTKYQTKDNESTDDRRLISIQSSNFQMESIFAQFSALPDNETVSEFA